MNPNDFRYMRNGKQISDLKKKDFLLLEPINQYGPKKERALLLLHGFASTPAVYRKLIPQLHHYDALICPALAGHAESIDAFAHTKAQDWFLSAKQKCSDLFKKFEKIDILGLSLGALLACGLSPQFSFNHMFLLAPALKLRMNINRNIKLLRALKEFGFCELRGMGGDILGHKNPEISYRRLPITTLIELFTLIHEYQWVAPTCPVDLFLGTHDAVIASKHVEELFSELPNTTIHWLTKSAHILSLDNDLKQIANRINEYGS